MLKTYVIEKKFDQQRKEKGNTLEVRREVKRMSTRVDRVSLSQRKNMTTRVHTENVYSQVVSGRSPRCRRREIISSRIDRTTACSTRCTSRILRDGVRGFLDGDIRRRPGDAEGRSRPLGHSGCSCGSYSHAFPYNRERAAFPYASSRAPGFHTRHRCLLFLFSSFLFATPSPIRVRTRSPPRYTRHTSVTLF